MKITEIGGYIPRQRVSNEDLLVTFDLTSDFINKKIGVRERSQKAKGETVSKMCCAAFQDLVARQELETDSVELLCVVTQNPDFRIPHMAAVLHNELGMSKRCMTFDLSQGCAGYVHAVALVSSMMETNGLKSALVFTCDPYSPIIDESSKNESLLFGDAATVTLMELGSDGLVVGESLFGTLPNSWECLRCDDLFRMSGADVFAYALREVPASITSLLERVGLSMEDVDLMILHQASKYLVECIRKKLALPAEKVPFDICDYGNTVSSSIPLILKNVVKRERVKTVVLSGFGVGFSWGSCVLNREESLA